MPTTKNAMLRYKLLDECLKNRNRRYTFDDLLNGINDKLYEMNGTSVSVRQLRADIDALRCSPYNAEIETTPSGMGRKRYYRYSDPDFSIFKNQMPAEDLEKLRSTLQMLSRYRGIGTNGWLEEVMARLDLHFGASRRGNDVVEFEQNQQLRGIERLGELIDAATKGLPLAVTYRTYKGDENTSTVHPYFLKQYNGRWFLFGLEENETYGNRLTNKALDRIEAVKPMPDTAFIPNKTVDFKEHFADFVGVTPPNDHPEPERVVVRLSERRFPYVRSKPIHHSQVVLSEDERLIALMVRPNKELEAQLFSFGPDAEVLEPQWLREEMAERVRELAAHYSAARAAEWNDGGETQEPAQS